MNTDTRVAQGGQTGYHGYPSGTGWTDRVSRIPNWNRVDREAEHGYPSGTGWTERVNTDTRVEQGGQTGYHGYPSGTGWTDRVSWIPEWNRVDRQGITRGLQP